MELKNKNAIIYGAGGAIGRATALAFATAGANVFLAGRTRDKMDKLAMEISMLGANADVSELNALNQKAVNDHLAYVVKRTGRIDISLNVIGIDDVQGMPLTEMKYEDFAQPVDLAVRTQFLTSTAVARQMIKQGKGVILFVTANAARKPYMNIGGFGVACAAMESLSRQLALETGKHGVRVVCLRSAGSPDTPGVSEVFDLHAKQEGLTREAYDAQLAEKTMLKRLPLLHEVANAAVLMASDRASAITAAVTNITCGEMVD